MEIKGYNVYFINIEVYKGLCAIAFKGGYQINYNLKVYHSRYNDDASFDGYPSDAELKEIYIKHFQTTLFTEDELSVVKNYTDYNAKVRFLINEVPNERDHLSQFYTLKEKHNYVSISLGDRDKDKKFEDLQKNYPIYNPVGMCFFKQEDKEFSDHLLSLYKILNKAKESSESEEYMESAFLYEMGNHEYMINWQADWDVCSCFGECTYGEDKNYRDYLKEMGKEKLIPAYERAKRKHYKHAENW
jgi:hypothetical protein